VPSPSNGPKAKGLVAAIEGRQWRRALGMAHLAKNSIEDMARLDPFAVALEVTGGGWRQWGKAWDITVQRGNDWCLPHQPNEWCSLPSAAFS
jgi:hypothetical protein